MARAPVDGLTVEHVSLAVGLSSRLRSVTVWLLVPRVGSCSSDTGQRARRCDMGRGAVERSRCSG